MTLTTVLALAADVIGCTALAAAVHVIRTAVDDEWRNRWH